jgi:hypothetical protein
MIRLDPGTGLTKTVNTQSQVRKNPPCKQAAHGPCFVFWQNFPPSQEIAGNFWDGSGYSFEFGADSIAAQFLLPGTGSGCAFNQLLRPFARAAPPGWTPAQNGIVYFKVF